MVSAMIDECMWEVKNENVKSEFKNSFPNYLSKRSTKRRKRICDAYNEIEYGYDKRRDKDEN